MKLEDFFRPVETLTDREVVEQHRILSELRDRRRRRRQVADDATARRLIESIDEPDDRDREP